MDAFSLTESRDSPPNIQAASPRAAVLDESIKRNLIPVILRDLLDCPTKKEEQDGDVTVSDGVIVAFNLFNKGLGDDKGICFARALPLTPDVHTINLAGNRLTDKSIRPIMSEVLSHLRCTNLNVSDNKIDHLSIEMIKANLELCSCTLKELHLSRADIDDEECAEMVGALHSNKSLRILDLSNNKIGSMEVG